MDPEPSGPATPVRPDPPAAADPGDLPAGLVAGLTGRSTLTVGTADTAAALGSGDVAVVGTPRVVGLVEAATVAALSGRLDASATSVGTRVEIEHRSASPVGAHLAAAAVLVRVNGRSLQFMVSVHDGAALVAEGRVDRVVVDRDRFLDRAGGRDDGRAGGGAGGRR